MTPLRLGARGDLVGEVHQLLIEQGFSIAPADLASEYYGASTVAAVRAFQERHQLKPVDGIVGPRTLGGLRAPILEQTRSTAPGWRFDPKKVRPQVLPALLEAVHDLGHREVPPGSNDGPDLKKYKITFNVEAGKFNPWCAYSASYWFSFAEGGCPWGVLGSGYKIRLWAEERGLILPAGEEILPGDVGITFRTRFRSHVWPIVHVADETALSTVEGNSGNMVRGWVKSRADATVIVRAFPLVPV